MEAIKSVWSTMLWKASDLSEKFGFLVCYDVLVKNSKSQK